MAIRPQPTDVQPGAGAWPLPRIRRVIAAACVLCLALLGALTLHQILVDRDDAIASLERENVHLARALGEHVVRTLGEVDKVLLDLSETIAARGGLERMDERDLHLLAKRRQASLPQVTNLGTMLPDGTVSSGSAAYPARRINFSSLNDFRYLAQHADGALRIDSAIKGPLSGEWVLPMTRRLSRPDGRFGGVVAAALSSKYLSAFYEELSLPAGSAIYLVLRDGRIALRYPFEINLQGASLLDSGLFEEGRPKDRSGSFTRVSPLDGQERIAGYRWLADPSLAVMISTPKAAVLDSWRLRAAALTAAAAASALLFGSVCMLLQYHLRRREEAEALLARTQYSVDHAQDMVLWLDREGWIRYANAAACARHGYGEKEMPGLRIYDLDPACNSQRFAGMWSALRERKTLKYERAHRSKDGGAFNVEVSGNHYVFHGEELNCIFLRDITERKHVEEELRTLVAEQKLILDNVVVGLAVFRNRRFVSCNAHLETMLGYGEGELIGQSAEVIHLDRRHFIGRGKVIYEAISGGRNFGAEEEFLRKDGSRIWLHTTGRAADPARPLEEDSVWIFVDVTERKRTEREIQDLNASLERRVARRTAELQAAVREMEAFSYSISHDLRAPLRAINGFAAILMKNEAELISAEGRGLLDRVVRNSIKMGQLIDDILEYSRLGRTALSRRKVDLDVLARNVVDDLREAHPSARIEIAPLPVVDGDSTMLRQVLENLVGNALKYSGKREAPLVEIGCLNRDNELVIYVRDNGVGFDMQFAGKLFGMFQRMHTDAEFPGTGVGLAIVKRLVERHGGHVWAEAEAGRGATFLFTLSPPAAPAAA